MIEILVSVPVVPLGPARPAPVVVGGDGEGDDHGDGGAQAHPPQHVQAPRIHTLETHRGFKIMSELFIRASK